MVPRSKGGGGQGDKSDLGRRMECVETGRNYNSDGKCSIRGINADLCMCTLETK